MLRRLTIIALLVIFAKPAYDLFIADYDSASNEPELTQPAPVTQSDQTNTVQSNVASSNEASEEVEEENKAKTTKSKVESEEELTEAIYAQLSQFKEQFSIQYVGSTKNIDQIIERASNAASKLDPFVEGHLSTRNISYTYNKLSAKIDIRQTYLISKQQADVVEASVKEIVASIKNSGLSDYEKVKFVNDYIVQNTVYSDQTVSSPHSAYTALMERKAVCQGYALLAQKMLTELGIESLYVVGEAGGIGHAWNLVQLDGEWFHLDTTWNDPLPDRGKEVRYEYFLISDALIAQDHTWDEADYPKALSNKYVIR